MKDKLPGGDVTLGEALMAPTVIYVKQVTLQILFSFCSFFYTLGLIDIKILQLFLTLQQQILDIISKGGVKGIAHITGGGFTDNIPRVFPDGLGAVIYKDSWEIPTVFNWIQEVNAY